MSEDEEKGESKDEGPKWICIHTRGAIDVM